MRYKKGVKRAKSDSSVIDSWSTRNISDIYKDYTKTKQEITVFYAKRSGSAEPIDSRIQDNSNIINETNLITSEKYHFLNRDLSYNSFVESSSTIFYDLDEVAKKQSFTYYVEPTVDQSEQCKETSSEKHAFGQPYAIVQECETHIAPKLVPRDSVEVVSKKGKKKFPNDIRLSSEIFLKDNNYEDFKNSKDSKRYFDKEITDQQRFWSYAKYRTEYTKPIPEEKKTKKKERGKRTEDPCPCQLFSYTCPCVDTHKKSLTELAKNTKSTENTQTENELNEKQRVRKHKTDVAKECKVTNTSFIEPRNKQDIQSEKIDIVQNLENDNHFQTNASEKISIGTKQKSSKRIRQVICPNCKETVEVVSSTEDSYQKSIPTGKYQNANGQRSSPIHTYVQQKKQAETEYRNHPYVQPRMSQTNISKNDDEPEYCNHDPPCELIPVCQVLAPDHTTKKYTKNSPAKSTPRIIRITKACRHHPPCTVVPSCQRANVLKNNCEFIPPCMHRPRCVNLPLCVPVSRTFNLDNLHCNPTDTTNECQQQKCTHVQRCKYACEQDSINSEEVNRQYNIAPQVQHICEHDNRYGFHASPPTRKISPSTICAQCHITCQNNFAGKQSKSCQYDVKESVSDAVVFIRDVGCQFRNKPIPKDSLTRLLTPSVSFELMNVKMGNYYSGLHTLRYEDKCTNPDSNQSMYESSSDSSSVELSPCSSPRMRRVIPRSSRATGFPPRTATYVTAFATCENINLLYSQKPHKNPPINLMRKDQTKNIILHQMNPVKSKKSILKCTPNKNKRRMKSKSRRRHVCSGNSHVM